MPPSPPSSPQPRVVFLPPLPPETLAYALARYSRSGDPVEASLAWVESHGAEKFWTSFYYDYGHASIADLGHVAACFEDVSELAALEILDEPLWDGQARSTRYQDFAAKGVLVPPELRGHGLEARYREGVQALLSAYAEVHAMAIAWLSERHPRPDEMDLKKYERNVAARAFDMARGLLPLGIPTSVGQVTSIRTLERQISRLLVSDLAELRQVAAMLVEGCSGAPLGGGKPVAPTLARHARPSEWLAGVRRRAAVHAREIAPEPQPPRAAGTILHRAPEPPVEMLASLAYGASGVPWGVLVERVEGMDAGERRARIEDILSGRGPHDELPRACRTGMRHVFEIVMDAGGWRDMHRHRRCVQLWQPLDVEAGGEMPPQAEESGIAPRVGQAHAACVALAREVAQACGPVVAQHALPLMQRMRSVFKMDFAEADYVARLRSGVKGHPSYRRVAWDMFEALRAAEPDLAGLLAATSPDVEDPLTR